MAEKKTASVTANDKAKSEALATALAQIEKKYGKGSIMKLGENTAMNVEAISTGWLTLDMALLREALGTAAPETPSEAALEVDGSGNATLSGAALEAGDDGSATVTGATLTVDTEGNATIA